MFGLGSALVAGGASLLGGVLTNQSNANEASKNREFQEDMSNTSYQRAVADMKAAGINPMLAASKGGASTPGGSMATMQNALGDAVSSANASRMLDAQIEQVEAGIAKTNKETEFIQEQIDSMPVNRELTGEQVNSTRATASLTARQEQQIQAAVDEALERTKNYPSERARNEAIVREIRESLKKYPLDRIAAIRAAEEALNRANKTKQDFRIDEPEAAHADSTGQTRPWLRTIGNAIESMRDLASGANSASSANSRSRGGRR